MEGNIDDILKKGSKTFIPFLPTYFKKIGVVLLIISFLPLIIVKIESIVMSEAQKGIIKYMSINVFILGLLLIAWAKDKVEDELTIALRLKSIVMAFIMAVFHIVFKPLADLLLGTPITDMKGQDIMLSMLFFYFILYFTQKKGSKYKS